MRNNDIKIIKVSGQEVTLKKLGHRMYYFSAVVNGYYVSATHYSRYGICVIREEIQKVLSLT